MPLFSGMDRSKLRNAVYSILLLAFFFAVGLAGGVLYRVLPTNKTPAPPETKLAEQSAGTSSTTTENSAASTAPPAATPAPPAAAPESTPATPDAAPQATAVAAAESQPAPEPAEKPAPEKAQAPAPSASPAAPEAPEAKAPAPAPKPAAAPKEAAKPAGNVKTAAIAPAAKPAPPKEAAAASKPTSKSAAKRAGGDAPPFRIQFGAFAIEDNAHRAQWAVEATGLPVEVTRAPSRKGRMLYYVRSQQPFPTRAAALAAAIAAHDKAKKFTHPTTIDYVVLNDAMIAAEEGHKAGTQQP
jgi:outer membrane biosynthesis protein TonB